eukprot:gene12256-15609_t
MRAGTLPAFAQATDLFIEQQPFAEDQVRKLAEALAQKPWEDKRIAMPPGWDKLTYDQYRDIRFNPEKSFWKGEPHQFSFDLFHSGFLFTSPADVYVVENGQAARINYSPELFTFGPQVPKQDGKGRQAAVEIMLNSPLISDMIFKGEVSEIKEIMKKSRNLGMQTFDQALFDAYENNVISYEDALRNADSVNDLRLQIKLNSQR